MLDNHSPIWSSFSLFQRKDAVDFLFVNFTLSPRKMHFRSSNTCYSSKGMKDCSSDYLDQMSIEPQKCLPNVYILGNRNLCFLRLFSSVRLRLTSFPSLFTFHLRIYVLFVPCSDSLVVDCLLHFVANPMII